ncbi:hypothetical protein [Cryptosporangium japonicum]|uniref:Uncharacterized protein n=1 Tax=Cryptosporangium japonicum TaxID=80872 RepID=A0ABP3EGL6_9ACTN
MQREHPSENSPEPAREFWVRVAIDGTARIVRVVARSPQDALRRFGQDLHRGGRLQYSTADGELVVEWGNVATLEVGPIVRVVRIVERPDGRS